LFANLLGTSPFNLDFQGALSMGSEKNASGEIEWTQSDET
jgi:hypothetical protein